MLREFDDFMQKLQWLVNLNHELKKNLTSDEYILTLWVLFIETPKKWIDNDKEAQALISKKENVTEKNKKTFKQMICAKYPVKKKSIFIDDERIDRIMNTTQRANETLRKYYERLSKIFVENDDQNYVENDILTNDERMLLTFFIKQFINDIRNLKLRQRVYAKYTENMIAEMKSLFEICVLAEKMLSVMQSEKRLELQAQKAIKNERFKALEFYLEQLNSFDYNIKTKAVKVVQNVLIDKDFSIDVMYNNNRRSQRQSVRISNNERIQNVSSVEYTKSLTSNTSGLQQYSEYFSQNSRNQSQASISSSRDQVRWKEQREKTDREFNAQAHLNRFINESVTYNKVKHDICCHNCDECDHISEQCTCSEQQKLTSAARRYLQQITAYKSQKDYYNSTSVLSEQLSSDISSASVSYQSRLFRSDESTISFSQPNVSQSSAKSTTYYIEILGNHLSANFAASFSRIDYMYENDDISINCCESASRSLTIDISTNYTANIDSKNISSSLAVHSLTLQSDIIDSIVRAQHFAVNAIKKRIKKNSDRKSNEKSVKLLTEFTATVAERSKKKEIKQKDVKKTLKPIANMIDHSEISVEKLLLKQTITLSALHLFQLSSHLRDETKRLINAFRKSRKKKVEKINQAKTSVFKINFASVRSNKNKRVQWIVKKYYETMNVINSAYEMSCILYKNSKSSHIDLSFESIKANQNSDFIIINAKLASNMKLNVYSSKLLNSNEMRMMMTNENRHELKFWIILNIEIEDIKRQIWAFVNPNHNDSTTKLLLDFSWLQSMHAQIDIKNKKIQIENLAQSEMIKNISSKIKIFDLIEMKHVKKSNMSFKQKQINVQTTLERIITKGVVLNVFEFEKKFDDSNEKFSEFFTSDSDSRDANFQ